ncbi:hypothetical protein OG320_05325 [Microbispora sp. NBC_01189]|uniref:hypothetical protein n=1 Tax=Microbispora sp. NBC_01189 TaxID=2903583 RepID=UPI002E11FF3C|nr:hypothetical protein OG320_05325 [Microbispora sp. NBC_01189]
MADSAVHERRGEEPEITGWRLWRSDAGRWWATRERRFGRAAEQAGAARCVDADDELALIRAVAEQESIAALAAAQ